MLEGFKRKLSKGIPNKEPKKTIKRYDEDDEEYIDSLAC